MIVPRDVSSFSAAPSVSFLDISPDLVEGEKNLLLFLPHGVGEVAERSEFGGGKAIPISASSWYLRQSFRPENPGIL